MISKNLIKKILHVAPTRQLVKEHYLPQIDPLLKHRGFKGRFIALHIFMDFIDPFAFLEENPLMIAEIFERTQ